VATGIHLDRFAVGLKQRHIGGPANLDPVEWRKRLALRRSSRRLGADAPAERPPGEQGRNDDGGEDQQREGQARHFMVE